MVPPRPLVHRRSRRHTGTPCLASPQFLAKTATGPVLDQPDGAGRYRSSAVVIGRHRNLPREVSSTCSHQPVNARFRFVCCWVSQQQHCRRHIYAASDVWPSTPVYTEVRHCGRVELKSMVREADAMQPRRSRGRINTNIAGDNGERRRWQVTSKLHRPQSPRYSIEKRCGGRDWDSTYKKPCVCELRRKY